MHEPHAWYDRAGRLCRLVATAAVFEVLIVGVMLVSEGAHKAHLHCFNQEIHAMQKSTFYFVIVIMVLIDIAQSRYQKKLRFEHAKESVTNAAHS